MRPIRLTTDQLDAALSGNTEREPMLTLEDLKTEARELAIQHQRHKVNRTAPIDHEELARFFSDIEDAEPDDCEGCSVTEAAYRNFVRGIALDDCTRQEAIKLLARLIQGASGSTDTPIASAGTEVEIFLHRVKVQP